MPLRWIPKALSKSQSLSEIKTLRGGANICGELSSISSLLDLVGYFMSVGNCVSRKDAISGLEVGNLKKTLKGGKKRGLQKKSCDIRYRQGKRSI